MIDICANLAHESFDADRNAVLERAWAAGVEAIIVTGSSADSSRKALKVARNYSPSPCGRGLGGGASFANPLPQSLPAGGREVPALYATAGLHPHHASDWDAEHAALFRELAQQPEVVALGEFGLDYNRNYSPHDKQKLAIIAQLELAAELKKPVFLHQRDAHAEFLPILKEFRPQLTDAVVHCFTDTPAALEDYLALDCHIGITGWICDDRRGHDLRQTVRKIPDQRLLIESDAPYLLPRNAPKPEPGLVAGPVRQRNEPCFQPYVVRALAKARGHSEAYVNRVTSSNAQRFFRLPADGVAL